MCEDVRAKLGAGVESPFWQEALAAAMAESGTPVWLTEDYLLPLDGRFQLLGEYKEQILKAAAAVAASEDLCLLARVLWHILGQKKHYGESFSQFQLPEEEAFDFLALLPVLGHVMPFVGELEQRGIGEDIIFDTLSFLRGFIGGCGKDRDRPRFDSLRYFRVFVYTEFLWAGRMRFEIQKNARRGVWIFKNAQGQLRTLMCDVKLHTGGHVAGTAGFENEAVYDADFRETEEFYEGHEADPVTGLAGAQRVRLDKSEWVPVLRPGDDLLKVHIPYRGRLEPEACADSYRRGWEAFRKGFPEYDFKGFVCKTWLLAPELREFLKEGSNILQFQKPYTLFPAESTGADAFLYVYKMDVKSALEVDPEALPEDNSMMRGVKQLARQGRFAHEFAGFIEM